MSRRFLIAGKNSDGNPVYLGEHSIATRVISEAKVFSGDTSAGDKYAISSFGLAFHNLHEMPVRDIRESNYHEPKPKITTDPSGKTILLVDCPCCNSPIVTTTSLDIDSQVPNFCPVCGARLKKRIQLD